MVSWVIIAALILLVIAFFKMKAMQHKLLSIFLIVLIIFFYMTGSKIIKENGVNLTSFDGIMTASKLYLSWLGQSFNNAKIIVGNAVKMDWGANETLTKK